MEIKSKEEARKEATAKAIEFMKTYYMSMDDEGDHFHVYDYKNTIYLKFPYANLKDGDLCVIKWRTVITSAYYFDNNFLTEYAKEEKFFKGIRADATLITKTGFNILDHLESEQSK